VKASDAREAQAQAALPAAGGARAWRDSGRRGIEARPPEVELRVKVGHREGDMAVGATATGRLATPAERVTRCTPAGWSAAKDADEVKSVVIGLLAAIGVACAGIAFDNGKEFARHAEIAAALKADVFFVRPYHSRERGTNESTNGPIRRLFPKEERVVSGHWRGGSEADRHVPERPPAQVSRPEDAEGGDGRLPCRSRVSGAGRQRVKPSPLPLPVRRCPGRGGEGGPTALTPPTRPFSPCRNPPRVANLASFTPEGTARPPQFAR
jgi:hypothetical protein